MTFCGSRFYEVIFADHLISYMNQKTSSRWMMI